MSNITNNSEDKASYFTSNVTDNKVSTVHLMAAAVDNEEVSTNPADILKDQTNWGTPKSDYGRAMEAEVTNFYNLFNPFDKVLAADPIHPYVPYQIYSSFETDWALGENGYQKLPENISALGSLPENYTETDVHDEILAICDSDADNKPDLPFLAGNTVDIGYNHGGYMGFRENKTKLIDAGAMDVVVHDWDNKTIINNNQNLNLSRICPS